MLEKLRVLPLVAKAVAVRVRRQRESKVLQMPRPEPVRLQPRPLPLEPEVLNDRVLECPAEPVEAPESEIAQ